MQRAAEQTAGLGNVEQLAATQHCSCAGFRHTETWEVDDVCLRQESDMLSHRWSVPGTVRFNCPAYMDISCTVLHGLCKESEAGVQEFQRPSLGLWRTGGLLEQRGALRQLLLQRAAGHGLHRGEADRGPAAEARDCRGHASRAGCPGAVCVVHGQRHARPGRRLRL